MPKIGLKEAYYSLIASDVKNSITYGNPVALTNVQKVDLNPRVSSAQVPGDDMIVDDISECLGADMSVQRVEFTLMKRACYSEEF